MDALNYSKSTGPIYNSFMEGDQDFMTALITKDHSMLKNTRPFLDFASEIETIAGVIQSTNASGEGKNCDYGKNMYCDTCGKSAIKQAYDIAKKVKNLTTEDVNYLIAEMTAGCNKITYTKSGLREKSEKRRASCLKYIDGKRDNILKWASATSSGGGSSVNDALNTGSGNTSGGEGAGLEAGVTYNPETKKSGMSSLVLILILGLVVTVVVALIIRKKRMAVAKA
ncbi:MAG: hypothetical protein WCT85_00725 [Parachlamydiales bacterium]|jgi:hypothetical protein